DGAERGEQRARLRFLPGGYGRMTPAYDRLVRVVNDFLAERGAAAGAVQRLGAGWGGNIGGLIRREFIDGTQREAFADILRAELGGEPEIAVAVPGEGAGLLSGWGEVYGGKLARGRAGPRSDAGVGRPLCVDGAGRPGC
ncbi:MAG: hypothetical protein VX293_02200, partial [Candidatus Latescibacterota bacterium]|nr:hypothetical protein [Candidatus Latescibacterota bacterium]